MSGLLASGGDAYSANHVNNGLYWKRLLLSIVLLQYNLHVPLLSNYGRYAPFGYLCMKGDVLGEKRRFGKEGDIHTHSNGIVPKVTDASDSLFITRSNRQHGPLQLRFSCRISI